MAPVGRFLALPKQSPLMTRLHSRDSRPTRLISSLLLSEVTLLLPQQVSLDLPTRNLIGKGRMQ
ncbi:hypothetical protein LINPERHAP1_LOCUS41149, partial [Linum perenne]